MKQIRFFILIFIFFLVIARGLAFIWGNKVDDDRFVTYIVNAKKQDIKLFWKDGKNKNFGSIQNLKSSLEEQKQKLVFAMNGGMYKQDNSPQGLFIQNQITLSPLDTSSGNGNFYLKPNGVFYLTTDNVPAICTSDKFRNKGEIKYATQSGPMLVINGQIHPAFKEGSSNLNIRNGVGILPDNRVIFVMSKEGINFYDFTNYFKSKGCKNALYLDGLVSRTYLPEQNWVQTDGNFGVIIAVSAKGIK